MPYAAAAGSGPQRRRVFGCRRRPSTALARGRRRRQRCFAAGGGRGRAAQEGPSRLRAFSRKKLSSRGRERRDGERPLNTSRSKGAGTAVPMWERWLPRVGVIASGFTTLCCIGLSVALSLASAVGATFLTRDDTLRPALIATLAFTIAGSALTFRRHRSPWPLVLTAVASAWIYFFVFGPFEHGHAEHGAIHDAMHAATAATHRAAGGPPALVWAGLAVLIGAQLWDFVQVRRCSAGRGTNAADSGGPPTERSVLEAIREKTWNR